MHLNPRTARLWDAACAQPLLEFSHLNTQPPRTPAGPASPAPAASRAGSNSSSAAAAAANPLLPHEVRAARFVYMDQFVLLACGNRLLLYRYGRTVRHGAVLRTRCIKLSFHAAHFEAGRLLPLLAAYAQL